MSVPEPLPPDRRQLSLALEALYDGGNHTFWKVYAETPRQAVAAFIAKPETFGALDPKLVGVDRRRLHARAQQLALALPHQEATGNRRLAGFSNTQE